MIDSMTVKGGYYWARLRGCSDMQIVWVKETNQGPAVVLFGDDDAWEPCGWEFIGKIEEPRLHPTSFG